jgi:hypothetical protein
MSTGNIDHSRSAQQQEERAQAEERTGRRAHRSHSEHRKGPAVVDYSPIAQVPTEVELVAHEEGELTNTSFGHAFMSWSRPTPSLLTLIRSLLTLIRSLLNLIRSLLTLIRSFAPDPATRWRALGKLASLNTNKSNPGDRNHAF